MTKEETFKLMLAGYFDTAACLDDDAELRKRMKALGWRILPSLWRRSSTIRWRNSSTLIAAQPLRLRLDGTEAWHEDIRGCLRGLGRL